MTDKKPQLLGFAALAVVALAVVVAVLMWPEPKVEPGKGGGTDPAQHTPATSYNACVGTVLNQQQKVTYDKNGELSAKVEKIFETGVKVGNEATISKIMKNDPGLLEKVVEGCKATALSSGHGEARRIISTQVFVKRALSGDQSVKVSGATVTLKTATSNPVVAAGDSVKLEATIPWSQKEVEVEATLGRYSGSERFAVDKLEAGSVDIVMKRVGKPLLVRVEGLPARTAGTTAPIAWLKPTFDGEERWSETALCDGEECNVATLEGDDSARFVYGGRMTDLSVGVSYGGRTKELPVIDKADIETGTVRVLWNGGGGGGGNGGVGGGGCTQPMNTARQMFRNVSPSSTVSVSGGTVSCSPGPCPAGMPSFGNATCPPFAIGR